MCGLLRGLVGLVAPPRCLGCDVECVSVFCTSCRLLLEPSPTAGAAFLYGGPVADAVHRFKYRGRSELSSAIGALMAERAAAEAGRVDVVVPVPLHWRRRRARGYDQAGLLAKPVARALRVPSRARGRRRIRNTASQVDLSHQERLDNVAGAFVPGRLYGAKSVLLVDDVKTTGATLASAARALRAGGVAEVQSLVFATRVLTDRS